MHKYQPRVHLVLLENDMNASAVDDLSKVKHKTFIFPETVFTAVTAYQNQLVSGEGGDSSSDRQWYLGKSAMGTLVSSGFRYDCD